jgi:hypothetical protein
MVTFGVSTSWKDPIAPDFVLHNAPESAEDIQFEPGLEYLVFATRNPPPIDTRFGITGPSFAARGCSGTVSMLWATRYLIDLGAGRRPGAESRPPHPRTLQ